MASRAYGRGSITLRLTALYTASALVILLGAASVLDWTLEHNLRVEDERLLISKTRDLQELVGRYPGRFDMLEDEVIHEPAAPSPEPFFIRLIDTRGVTSLETTGMVRLLPPSIFPPGGVQPVAWRGPPGRTFLLYQVALDRTMPTRRVQVALDVTYDVEVLAGNRRVLASVILLGTLLSGGAGYLVARRGLRPIGRITAAAKEVSASRLDQRIAGSDWPAELAELAKVFDGMLDRLQDSFGRLSRFSADLAHELRTPLTNLRAGAEVAVRRARSPEEYRQVIESALEEYGRLTGLVDRLLFLARADANAIALQVVPLDLKEVIEDVCEYYRPLAEEAGIELIGSGDGYVSADSLLLRRAIGNLLENAIEHTQAGGRVAVSTRASKTGLDVSVSDTGSGLAADQLDRVFDRFYQVDPSRERRRAGSGLGLALVRSIMELHGGTVRIRSEPRRETTVTLTFPSLDTTP